MAERSERGVIDAILDQVEDTKESRDSRTLIFRAEALDAIDITRDVDTRITLVSRRVWVAIVGVALVLIVVMVWAWLTPSTQSVTGSGRVTGAGVAVLYISEAAAAPVTPGMSVRFGLIPPGQVVGFGDPVLPEDARAANAVDISGTAPVVPVFISVSPSVPVGAPIIGDIIIAESTVLKRILD